MLSNAVLAFARPQRGPALCIRTMPASGAALPALGLRVTPALSQLRVPTGSLFHTRKRACVSARRSAPPTFSSPSVRKSVLYATLIIFNSPHSLLLSWDRPSPHGLFRPLCQSPGSSSHHYILIGPTGKSRLLGRTVLILIKPVIWEAVMCVCV